jgi:hypothetical protein
MTGSAPRRAPAALSGAAGTVRTQRPWIAFCARCGLPPTSASASAGATAPTAFSRVCRRCGMGLMLRAPDDVAPAAGEAFLVVDRALAVCAVSETAEPAVGVTEPFAIGRLISELVVPEATASGADGLLMLVRRAVLDGGPPRRTSARLATEETDPVTVRIGPCGPPRAALIALEA